MSDLSKKISDLQNAIDPLQKKIYGTDRCIPTMLIAGMIAPIVFFAALFFIQPSFVQKKDGSKYVRDNRKVFFSTLAITTGTWVLMYLWSYCNGFSKTSLTCTI